MPDFRNGPVIQVLRNQITRERDRIERAQAEIIKLKEELLDLGIDIEKEEGTEDAGL